MSAKQQVEKEIREAIIFLREKNHTIPSETIEFMKQASLEKLNYPDQEIKTYWFDCWDKKGKTYSKNITALTAEQAKIIFKSLYPNYGYDEPYY